MPRALNPQWLVNRFPRDLKAQIRYLVTRGFLVVHQDETTAQLLKKKKFSCLFCIVLGVIPYFIWYLAKRDRLIYLDLPAQQQLIMNDYNDAFREWFDEYGLLGVFVVIFFILAGLIAVFLFLYSANPSMPLNPVFSRSTIRTLR